MQDTQMALQDPIQEDLWKDNHFSLVAHECFLTMENKKHLQGLALSPTQGYSSQSLPSTSRVRHVSWTVSPCG